MINDLKKTYTSTKYNNSNIIYRFTHNSYLHTKTFFMLMSMNRYTYKHVR